MMSCTHANTVTNTQTCKIMTVGSQPQEPPPPSASVHEILMWARLGWEGGSVGQLFPACSLFRPRRPDPPRGGGRRACMGRCPDTRGGGGGSTPSSSDFSHMTRKAGGGEGSAGTPPPLSFPYKPGEGVPEKGPGPDGRQGFS